MTYSIGIDVGGTGIKAAIVDESCKIVRQMTLPTLSQAGKDDGEKVVNAMEKLVRELCAGQQIPLGEIASIGAGIPGTIDDENGVVIYTNNIDLHELALREILQARLGKSIHMGNDADVAAFGEYMAGATAGCESSLMITLGTGVGSGLILGGKIYTGYNHRGGEFGHTVVQVGGVRCTCGREGCLESYASATGLIRMTKEAMEQDLNSYMWKLCEDEIDNVNGKTAFDAMEKGDATGRQVVNQYIRYLGAGLANFINMLHPEKICLGGGISKSGDDLLIPLREAAYKNVYGGADGKTTQIVLAALGSNAGVIGAAMLGHTGERV